MSDVPLVRLLSMAVTVALEELHTELAREGHGTLRPAHGYALNAVVNGHDTASQIAALLGMTKQGAAKLVKTLVDDGYLAFGESAEGDARRKPLALTPRGEAAVQASVRIQNRIEAEWTSLVGAELMTSMRLALENAVTHSADGQLPPVRRAW